MSPNVNDLKRSKFLGQKDVDPPVLVTITKYEEINIARDGAEPDERWVLIFKELEKPLILNTTNGQIIAAITGSGEFTDWIGRQIVLYLDPNVSFGGKLVGGIRCRAPKTQAQNVEAEKPATGDDIPF